MKVWAAIAIVLALASCSMREHGLMREPYPEIKPLQLQPQPQNANAPGSLYSPQTAYTGLVSDARAYRVNDIVLVRISESLSATNASNTDTERTTTNSFKVPNLLNVVPKNPNFFGGSGDGTVVGTSVENEHEGQGTTQRSGTFRGSLAARVIQVLPNNYLMIQGYKTVQVNGERTKIHLSGVVNPLMIDKDHSVASTEIADLALRFGGEGIVSAQQSPGWLSRFLNFVWPF